MATIIKKIKAPITYGERGEHIGNLQQACIQLGFIIASEEELKNLYFQEATLSALQRFQTAQRLPVTETLDSATASKLNSLLFLDDTPVFEISGTVLDSYRKPIPGHKVIAFDVDLRGAAIYGSVQSLEEIQEKGGLEILGEAKTDRKGEYTIWFGQPDFQQAERDLADVVAYGVEESIDDTGSSTNTITGISRLAYKKEYERKNRIERLDIRLSSDRYQALTEYARILQEVTPFLRESDIELQQLSTSEDQISFLSEEINWDLSKVRALVLAADILQSNKKLDLNQELLYGLGSQQIPLNPFSLGSTSIATLKRSLSQAIALNSIATYTDDEIEAFCQQLHSLMIRASLDTTREDSNATPRSFFNLALPDRQDLQERLLMDYVNHEGSPDSFWDSIDQHPIFREQPELLLELDKVGQLALLFDHHLPLVEELWGRDDISKVSELLEIEDEEWLEILDRTGLPFTYREDESRDQMELYMRALQEKLNATYPTQKVAYMVNQRALQLQNPEVASEVTSFLNQQEDFDFRSSRIIDFEDQIAEISGNQRDAVIEELKGMQRIFQLSPTPEAMSKLSEIGLNSAFHISRIPRQSFMDQYGEQLGDEIAFNIYEKASYMQARNTYAYTKVNEMQFGITPGLIWGDKKKEEVQQIIEQYIPNWETLFGRLDICECEHCRSVFSPAAYLVDILQFLKESTPNQDSPKKNPYMMMAKRRPDIAHLPLTCENTHTVIPYIDLVNEILEYYVVHDKIEATAAHDTDEATTDELQAEPQYTLIDAYKKLAQAVYPFSLPYHQPLDVIHQYMEHLDVDYANLISMYGNDQNLAIQGFQAAMALKINPAQYEVITQQSFDGTPVNTSLWEYYGYTAEQVSKLVNGIPTIRLWKEWLIEVPEFLKRAGLAYTELVALLKTRLINPHPEYVIFLENIQRHTEYSSNEFYGILNQVYSGNQTPEDHPDLLLALQMENLATGRFTNWLLEHFEVFKNTITLFEPDSACNLETTSLKSIRDIYEPVNATGISDRSLSLIHRFIRLQRIADWKTEDLDMMMYALGKENIDPELIQFLVAIRSIQKQIKISNDEVIVLWGAIDSFKEKSLYKKLFLTKSLLNIDPVFIPDANGELLVNAQSIKSHITAIQSALRLTADEINLIARENNIAIETDQLTLHHLSVFYRYKIFSKALKVKIKEFIWLKSIFNINPFSILNNGSFESISPGITLQFIELTQKVLQSNFSIETLSYLLLPSQENSKLQPDSNLITNVILQSRQEFIQIDALNQIEARVDENFLTEKLSLLFEQPAVTTILDLINDNAIYSTIISPNLDISIPAGLLEKVTYQKATGMLTFRGVMTEDEKNSLLSEFDPSLSKTVEEIYQQPEVFIKDTLYGVFENTYTEAIQLLLNRPELQNPPETQDKLQWFYKQYLPFLQLRLKQNIVVQGLAGALNLQETHIRDLIGNRMETLIHQLSAQGLSASYYSDANFSNLLVQQVDRQIDFDWADTSPDPLIPSDNFSVRWEGWLLPTESEPITFVVSLADEDDLLKVWIDEILILDRQPNQALELEALPDRPLKSGQAHHIRIEYQPKEQLAGLKLYWKTPSKPKTSIDSTHLFPIETVQSFQQTFKGYYKAGLLIQNFNIQTDELAHFIAYASDFDQLDVTAPSFTHWIRLYEYFNLKKEVNATSEQLINIFRIAYLPNVASDRFLQVLEDVTDFMPSEIEYWFTSKGLTYANFINEQPLLTLYKSLKTAQKTGVSLEQLTNWTAVTDSFQQLFEISQEVKRAVKIKYDESIWLEVAPKLNDVIRENQQQALIAYLLMQESLQSWGVYDANGLFEYFLIDVQMDACMDTSRVKQAISSVQLFIQRCLLNLESDYNDQNKEIGVAPGAIDTNRWVWMKNYRVWEANRKVFLYPENWLEPQWRDDKSPFFRELESELMQGDITQDTVEKAFRGYLHKVEVVSKMDLTGQYYDTASGILHLIGRTISMPYQYYYRQQNTKYDIWTPWEKIDLDIKGQDSVYESGVHIIPVVWQSKLYLFWPELTLKENPKQSGGSIINMGNKTQDELQGTKVWEAQIAWSEYKENTWQPKQVFPRIMEIPYTSASLVDIVTRQVWRIGGQTNLEIAIKGALNKTKVFRITNMHDTPEIITNQNITFKNASNGNNSFMRTWSSGLLTFQDKTYLNQDYLGYSSKPLVINGETYYEPVVQNTQYVFLDTFELLPSHQYANFRKRLDIPLFFQDRSSRFVIRDKSKKGKYRVPEKHFGLAALASSSINTTLNMSIQQNNVYSQNILSEQSHSTQYMQLKKSSNSSNTQIIAQEHMNIPGGFNNAIKKISGNLHFDIFYHPYTTELIGALNQGGVDSLFSQQFILKDDQGQFFKENYYPTVWVHDSYPQINLDFQREGAYSSYNWEAFYHIPLMTAVHLSKNNKFKEAQQWFHYIFDPTTNEAPNPEHPEDRYWKFLPFRTITTKNLEAFFESLQAKKSNTAIDEWRDNPFRPHLVARHRPEAYMKKTVMAYVDNLTAWGDQLFRQDTMESINEATQLYVQAAHILGPRPQFIPRRGKIKPETYATLAPKLDTFSNAHVALENVFPYSSEITTSATIETESLLGVGSALYFCIPSNEDLLKYWDTVADRLFKIRHCMNIDGVVRQLSLFEPPIDPGALIKALASGMSIGSVLSNLNAPTPLYRFTYIFQRALELTQEVKSLGNSILSAIEKKEAEHLSVLRASHEVAMQMEIKEILNLQIESANHEIVTLEKTWDTTKARFKYYKSLLIREEDSEDVSIDENGEVTGADPIPLDISVGLRDSEDEPGIKLIGREMEEIDQAGTAHSVRMAASVISALANAANFIPNVGVKGEPWGVGGDFTFGGSNVGAALSAHATASNIVADHHSYKSQSAARLAGYMRREQEWNFSANQAALELKQIAKQIQGAQIRKQITEQELTNHLEQIKRSEDIEIFLLDTKFTNEELYGWMKNQIASVYKASYNLAYEMAKQAEKAYQFEYGDTTTSFIQYGYWDSTREGLLAGEQLQLSLNRLHRSYVDKNKRDYEITKHMSLSLINPRALLKLKETGACEFEIPELLFDLDFAGQYFRRIKSVSITIPCIVGPYTSVSAKLTLLKNRVRKNGNSQTPYAYTGIEDANFTHNLVGMQSVATSQAQGDSGLFELNFRDERYLPFEGAGAISRWKLQLPEEFRSFDYNTISDVILHMNYTARDGGDALKLTVNNHLNTTLNKWMDELSEEETGLVRMISMKQEFSSEWHQFFQSQQLEGEGEQSINRHLSTFGIKAQHFPYFLRERELSLLDIGVILKPKIGADASSVIGLPIVLKQGKGESASPIPPTPDNNSGLQPGIENLPTILFNIEENPIGWWQVQLDTTSEPLDQSTIEDMYLVVRYKIDS